MSQPAISFGSAMRPMPKSSPATVGLAHAQSSASKAALPASASIDDRSVCRHLPTLDGVVMVIRPRVALLKEILLAWLHGAGFVGRAARQNRRRALPPPGQPEPCEAFRQHRLLQRRPGPGGAAIGADFDSYDLSASGPGETRDFVKALRVELLSA